MKINGNIHVPDEAIEDFCRRWKIIQIEVFGSALREDFQPDSDVDLLVTFEKDARHSLFEIMHMEEEMAKLVGRPVDLIERAGVERSTNPYRRHAILSTAQVVYRVA